MPGREADERQFFRVAETVGRAEEFAAGEEAEVQVPVRPGKSIRTRSPARPGLDVVNENQSSSVAE